MMIVCDADVSAFEKCLAPMWPDAWNHWRVFVLYQGQPIDTLTQQLKSALMWWTAKYEGRIRHVEITWTDSPPWKLQPVTSREHQCQGIIPTLKPGQYRTAYIRFVYRGNGNGLPWLSLAPGPLGLGAMTCPIGATTVLDRVYEPKFDAPQETTDPLVPPAVESAKEIVQAAVMEATGANKLERYVQVGLVIAGLGVAAYWLRGK